MDSEKVVCISLLLIILGISIIISIVSDFVYINNQSDDNNKPIDNYGKEVYHLNKNIYTYSDAQKTCSKYNATLATKKQINDAYNNGANWCNYGWSADSNAYFPIQQDFYDNLDDNEKRECGNVGINGGYFYNNNLQFGANCYGRRPSNSDLVDGDTIVPFHDNWSPDGNKVETFVLNGQVIPILNMDDGYDKLHKFE